MSQPTEGSAPKLCVMCGLDCSGKPRSKDARGQYVCKECIDHAKSTKEAQIAASHPHAAAGEKPKAASPEPDTTDNAFLLKIGESAEKPDANSVPCPNCHKKARAGTVVCLNCGFNNKTGEQLHVRVLKPK